MDEDLAMGIGITIAIILFIVLEILLINGTLPGMGFEGSAKDDIVNGGFSTFILYNIMFLIVSFLVTGVVSIIFSVVGKTFFITLGVIGVVVLLKYGIYKIFW